MEQIIPLLPLAHYVTMFEACPHLTWMALIGGVPLAVFAGALVGHRRKRTFLIIPAMWMLLMVLYWFGVRTYIQSKPGGYWCRNACIESLRQIDSGKEQWNSEQAPVGNRLKAPPEE